MMNLNYKINELSRVIESIEKIKSLEDRLAFYIYADKYISEYLKAALEYLIMKRDIQKNIVETKGKLDEIHEDGKRYDQVYKEMEGNFLSSEQGLIQELLEYAPEELVENVKECFYRHRKFEELYALKRTADRLARIFDSVVTISDSLKENKENIDDLF